MWKITWTHKSAYKWWRIWTRILEGLIEDLGFDMWNWGGQMSGKYCFIQNSTWLKNTVPCYLRYLDFCVRRTWLGYFNWAIRRWIIVTIPFLLLELLFLLVEGLLLWPKPGLWAHFVYYRTMSLFLLCNLNDITNLWTSYLQFFNQAHGEE